MKIGKTEQVHARPVNIEGARAAKIRLLISEADGAANFFMRQFLVAPGGCTPRHAHPWEHEMFILSGAGQAVGADGEKPIEAGDFVFIAPDELHQIVNSGAAELRLLCLVPKSAQ